MVTDDSTSSLTGTSLIYIGATATTVGGLGVGFRAAGLGYLGQSLLALVIGVALLTVGLKLAAAARRSVFDEARLTPARVHAAYRPSPAQRFVPASPSAFSTGATPARIRVPAWVSPQLELPSGRAA